jgi:putative spermidine/putrescine transport system ATP-binding protein
VTVQFENVSFRYPGTSTGVENIDLAIDEGELIAVIGPSGSGKSTLLMMLAGFLVPDSGRILIDGEDTAGKPPEKRDLGLVFQSYALFTHMRVWENVAYPLKVRGVPPRAAARTG